ncbi:hypothetical protein CRG98_007271, partial [Punica granatum]
MDFCWPKNSEPSTRAVMSFRAVLGPNIGHRASFFLFLFSKTLAVGGRFALRALFPGGASS